ncbi:MAG: SDR family oxidoreductase [Meiothermus sp.]|nr:SDR family oxidoreductase [Meiothermus sp.]
MARNPRKATLLAALVLGAAVLAARRERPKYSFAGKAVLITGGATGLGLAMARMLAREGAKLAICGLDDGTLEKAGAELERAGAEVLALPCDLTRPQEVRAFVQMVENHFGRLDVLVNNAGMIQVGPLENMTLEDFHQAMNTNFYGALHTTLAALPRMLERREGRIVNISSVAGLVPAPHLGPYSASKFALTGLSESLRMELAAGGIVTTLVCPGEIRSGAHKSAVFKGQVEAEYAWFTRFDVADPPASSAESVARRAIEACRQGRALEVVGLSAKVQALAHHLSPRLSLWAAGLFEKYGLPKPDASTEGVRGRDVDDSRVPAYLRRAGEEAARRLNQPDN